jgi:hypothetical protein
MTSILLENRREQIAGTKKMYKIYPYHTFIKGRNTPQHRGKIIDMCRRYTFIVREPYCDIHIFLLGIIIIIEIESKMLNPYVAQRIEKSYIEKP